MLPSRQNRLPSADLPSEADQFELVDGSSSLLEFARCRQVPIRAVAQGQSGPAELALLVAETSAGREEGQSVICLGQDGTAIACHAGVLYPKFVRLFSLLRTKFNSTTLVVSHIEMIGGTALFEVKSSVPVAPA